MTSHLSFQLLQILHNDRAFDHGEAEEKHFNGRAGWVKKESKAGRRERGHHLSRALSERRLQSFNYLLKVI